MRRIVGERLVWALLLLVVSIALPACVQPQPSPTPTVFTPPDAAELLQDVRSAMLSVQSFQADGVMTTAGDGTELTDIVSMRQSTPGVLYYRLEQMAGEPSYVNETLIIDGQTYVRSNLPHFDTWSALPASTGGQQPTSLVTTLGFILPPEQMDSLADSEAELNGKPIWVLTGQRNTDQQSSSQVQVTEPAVTKWTVSIDPGTNLVQRMVIDADSGTQAIGNTSGETQTNQRSTLHVVLDVTGYNQPVEIDVPINLPGAPTPLPTSTPMPTPGIPQTMTITFEPVDQVDGSILDEIQSVLNTRFGLVLGTDPKIERNGSTFTWTIAPNSLTEAEARNLIESRGVFQIVERRCLAYPCDRAGSYEYVPSGLGNGDIVYPTPGINLVTGKPIVLGRLTPEATIAFAKLTQKLFNSQNTGLPSQLAWVLDGKTIVSAVVNAPITSGAFQIEGDFTPVEAASLAAMMDTDPLPVQLRVTSVRSIIQVPSGLPSGSAPRFALPTATARSGS